MTAKVAALTRYPAKGEPGERLEKANLLAGLGMEGNVRRGGERQLCLLTAEIRRWMDSRAEEGLCFARLKENILLEGMPGGLLPTGACFAVGGAVLRMSADRKSCHPECALAASGRECRLSRTAVFAAIEQGGRVCVGDLVL